MSRLVAYALVYILLAWALIAAAKLLAYLAVSVDDFYDVAVAALSHAVAGMWLPPAILLIATHQPGQSVLGICLIANTTRILIAQRAPQARSRPGIAKDRAGLITFIVGALSFQSALCAWWWLHPLTSAALFGLSTWL